MRSNHSLVPRWGKGWGSGFICELGLKFVECSHYGRQSLEKSRLLWKWKTLGGKCSLGFHLCWRYCISAKRCISLQCFSLWTHIRIFYMTAQRLSFSFFERLKRDFIMKELSCSVRSTVLPCSLSHGSQRKEIRGRSIHLLAAIDGLMELSECLQKTFWLRDQKLLLWHSEVRASVQMSLYFSHLHSSHNSSWFLHHQVLTQKFLFQ